MAELTKGREARLEALRAELEAEQEAEARAALEARAAELAGSIDLAIDAPLQTEPMTQQVAAMNFAAALFRSRIPGVGLLMEQGTGKSLVALGLVGAMAKKGAVRWALIVCPNSLTGTWGNPDPRYGQIAQHSALDADVLILRGPKTKRLEAMRRQLLRSHKAGRFCWIITNVDQFSTKVFKRAQGREVPSEEFETWLDLIEEAPPAALIVDESSVVKNPNSRRSRALRIMAPKFRTRLILTGTPITKNPLDAWSQFEILDPGCLGHHTYMAFERYYAVLARRKFGARSFMEVVGFDPERLAELEGRVASLSYRCRAKDCLDLPPVTRRQVDVEITPEQKRTLVELKKEMIGLVDSGLVDGRNILTRYQRMAQILGGSVPTMDRDGKPTGEVHLYRPNPKLVALSDYLTVALDDPTAKAVIFCLYRAEIQAVAKLATEKKWGPLEFHGDVKPTDRDEHLAAFASDPSKRILVAQYQAGSYGLNLTAANHLVFYSLTFSLEHFLQAQKRVDRIGQERPVSEAYLVAHVPLRGGKLGQTLDHLILESLHRKRGFADLITGDAAAERGRLEDLGL